MYFLRNLLLSFVIAPWAFAAIANEYKTRNATADQIEAGQPSMTSQSGVQAITSSKSKSDRLPILASAGHTSAVFAISHSSWTEQNSRNDATVTTATTPFTCQASRFVVSSLTATNADSWPSEDANASPTKKRQDRISITAQDDPVVPVCLGEELFAECEQSGNCSSHGVLVRYNI